MDDIEVSVLGREVTIGGERRIGRDRMFEGVETATNRRQLLPDFTLDRIEAERR